MIDERRKPRRQDDIGKNLRRGYPDHAGKVALALRDKALDGFGFARNTLRLRQNGGARFGQAITVPIALEEPKRERGFERGDATGNRRLIDAEFASGRERAASARGGQEKLQIAPVVHSSILRLRRTVLQ